MPLSTVRSALVISLLVAALDASAQTRPGPRRPPAAARRATPARVTPEPAPLRSRADAVGSLAATRALPPLASRASSPRPAEAVGELSPTEVRAVVVRHLGAVNRCHERGLAVAPHASGVVFVRFEIGADGRVIDASVASNTYPVEGVAECIATATRAWVFPPPREGGPVTVDYPFTLEAPGSP
ncbi:MAG: AgmX/PglI C-terminal domain-containing protein [Polyangiales bacterium]